MMSRLLRFALMAHCLIFGAAQLVRAQVTDLGQIKRTGEIVIPVALESASPAALKLASAAFNLHGGYLLVAPNQAAYLIRIQENTEGAVLEIASGSPVHVQIRQQFLNPDAVLKACDTAVLKTSGRPGFFTARMAFVSDRTGFREIYISDLFLRSVKQLTHDKNCSITPHMSPDGHKLVYTSYYRSGAPDVFLIDLSTGQRTVLANYTGTNTGGAWDSAGNKVALICSSVGNAEVYVVSPGIGQPKRLTHTQALEASPCWSPKGDEILFTSDRLGGPQLFIIHLNTNATRRITTQMSRYCAEGAWNKVESNLIAFTGAVSKGFQIGIFDLSTNQGKFVTSSAVYDYIEPCWLPDGRHLIVTRRDSKSSFLCVLDSLTGQIKPLHEGQLANTSQASVYGGETPTAPGRFSSRG